MGRHFFSYHLDGDDELKVDLGNMDNGLYSLDFLNLRIGIAADLNSLHELISKAEALIEIEQMRLKEANHDIITARKRSDANYR